MEHSRPARRLGRTLQKVFGIDKLRPGQEEVIRSVLSGQNTLALMPTGAGKSLCYQIPALHLPGTTIVISPLIALMKDQVDKLGEVGIRAGQVHSGLSAREQRQNIEEFRQTKTEFLFITPERMATPEFLETLQGKHIDFVVIDESHCISQWGHEFRPSYLALGAAIDSIGKPPVLALTATATPEVVADIQKQLHLGEFRVINTGIYRPNLNYQVVRAASEHFKQQHLLRLINEIDGSGIVYCATVKTVKAVTESLQNEGHNVRAYHGKMRAPERKENQDLFMAGGLKAVIATNAFGMGIDKSDIRFVIHYQLPGSLEAYYQESGRAGRDGERARCLLLYQLEDRRTQSFFMAGRYPNVESLMAIYQALKTLRSAENAVRLSELQESVREIAKKKLQTGLHLLKQEGVVHESRYGRFRLQKRDLDREKIEQIAREYDVKAERDQVKLEQMMLYGQSALCRWKFLHDYFNEQFDEHCGHCDNCILPLEEQLGATSNPGLAPVPA